MPAGPSAAPPTSLTLQEVFSLVFGLFLGLAIWKFGNPVILDAYVQIPRTPHYAWSDAWPPRWGIYTLAILVLPGIWLGLRSRPIWPASRWLWILPVIWFGWQLLSFGSTVDRNLSLITLGEFAGCILSFYLGVTVVRSGRGLRLLLPGLLAAFVFCLVRAVDQRLFEFPQERQMMLEGERIGWTNFTPEVVEEMKQDGAIISTNGAYVANPKLVVKYTKGRAFGTLVYPNALAGIVLMLWPMALTLAAGATRRFRPLTRAAVFGLALFLGGVALFWSGSKSGWLIALGLGGLCLFRLDWPRRLKLAALAFVLLGGLGVFAIRFHEYFATGATSISARFDYWRAAAKTTATHPLLGTGPGTFQRPYAELKSPDAEMARLTHNDYLEQFSDSGFVGGLSYLAWIVLIVASIGRKLWPLAKSRGDRNLHFSLFLGLAGWFAQGFAEFELYVPALAWTAFTLAGALAVECKPIPAAQPDAKRPLRRL